MVQSLVDPDQELLIKAQVLEAIQKIGFAPTPQALLEALSDSTVLRDATRLAIMLFESEADQSKTHIKTVAMYDSRPDPVDRVGFAHTREDMPLPWEMDVSQPFIAENISLDSRLNDYTRNVLTQIGVQSLASFALVPAETHLGWLLIEYETPRKYTSSEITFFQILTKQIAITLHNQLLVQELSLRTQELETEKSYLNRVYQVTTQLDTAGDIETLFQILVDFATTIQTSYYLFYVVEDAGTEHFKCSEQLAPPKIFYQQAKSKINDLIVINDTSADPNWTNLALFSDDVTLGSVIVAPLDIYYGRAQGLIMFGHTEPAAFSKQLCEQVKNIAAQVSTVLKNILLLEDSQASLSEAQILVTASRMLSTSLELEDAYKAMGQVFLDTGADKCTLGIYVEFDLYDEPTHVQIVDIRGRAVRDEDLENIGRIYRLADYNYPYLDSARKTGHILTITDVPDDPNLNDDERALLSQLGIQAHANIPLISKGISLGFVLIEYQRSYTFPDRELALLRTIANQTTVVIEHSRQIANTKQRARQIETGAEISKIANRILNQETLLERVVNLIRDGFNFYYVGLFLVDEAGEQAVLKAGTGEAGSAQTAEGHKLALKDQSMIGWCITHKQARTSFDVGDDAVWFDNPYLPLTRSEMALPLITRDIVMGAITIQSTRPAAFSQEDIVTLQTMADQIANALLNARLLEAAQQRSDELSALLDINRDISASVQLDRLLNLIIARATDLVKGDQGTIFLLEDDVLVPKATAGGLEEIMALRVSLGDGVTGQAALRRQPFVKHIDDPETIKHIPGTPPVPETMVAIPIQTEAELIGVLLILRNDITKKFTEVEVKLLEAIALQAAIAFENANLLTRTQQAQEQISTIVDNIPGAVYHAIVDQYYRFQYISDDITDITGYPPEAFLDQNRALFHEIIHPDDHNRVRAVIRNRLSQQESYRVQYRIIAKTGEIKYISERGRGTFDPQKNLSYVDGIIFDITDREILQRAFQRRATQFEAIVQVGQEASAILDVDQLISTTVEQISQTFGFYYAGLFLLDSNKEWAVLKAGSGEAGKKMVAENHRLKRDETSMVGWATYHGKARIALDVGDEPSRFSHPYLPLTRSEIALPLITRAKVIGALDVQSQEQNAFSDDDIATLQLMANHLANVIENAQLFEQTQRQLQEQAALSEVARVASSTLDIQQIFKTATKQIVNLSYLDVERCRIFIHNETFNNLRIVASSPDQQDLNRVIPIVQKELSPKPGRQQQKPLLTKDPTLTQMLGSDIGSAAFVPISTREQFRGFIGLGSIEVERIFGREDLSIGETVANQVGIALEKAELFTTIQEREQSLSAINEMTLLANSSLDLRKILAESSQHLVDIFKVNYCTFFIFNDDDTGTIQAEYPDRGNLALTLPLERGSFLDKELRENKQIVVIEDVAADPRLGELREWYLDHNFSSVLVAPLLVRGKSIGAFSLYVTTEIRRFRPQEIDLAASIGNTIAVSIDNARLFETTQQNLRETDLLYRTTQALIKARNEDELFSLFIEKTVELGADSVSVSLFGGEGEGRYLEVKKIWSRYSTPFQTGQRYELKGFFLEPLITQAKMFVIQDITTDERLTDAMRQQFRALDAYSIVIIPIMLQKPVGTVHITYKKQPRAFTDGQIRLFESMVQQLTLIWQNLQLVASLERQFRRERIIREVTGKIHAATGVDQILRTTVFELTKALNAPAGVAHLKINQNAEPSPAEATSPNQSDH